VVDGDPHAASSYGATLNQEYSTPSMKPAAKCSP
jgi:hypothetical protein